MAQGISHPPQKTDTPGWLPPTVEKLAQLLALGANWDSYGARPIDPQLPLAALRLLAGVMRNSSPPPDVVPTSRGTIQLEWHRDGVDLEIDVQLPCVYRVCYESSTDSWEREVNGDASTVAAIVAQISDRN